MRILVVEDDDVLREGLVEGLAMEGHTVDAVLDCQDAREAANGFAYDAIVLDIGLPDGSGLDLLSDWRRKGHKTPVLLLTARNMAEDRIAGLDMSRREFAVLEVLARRSGNIVSRSQIEDAIYGWQEEVGSNAVEVHIHKLRGKLGAETIETVRGVGYRLRRT